MESAKVNVAAPPVGLDFGILLNIAFSALWQGLHEHLARHGCDDLGGTFGCVMRAL
jgi:hypothetical protein